MKLISTGIIGILILIIVVIWLIKKRFDQLEERNEVIYKWMFNSLYAISPNVLLPEEKEPTVFKEAEVFIDPMAINRGEVDDWHGLIEDD